MAKTAKSVRGVEVDFDVLSIKQQLADSPAPTEVSARESFVEKRLKRKLKNKTIPASVMPKLEVADPADVTAQAAAEAELLSDDQE